MSDTPETGNTHEQDGAGYGELNAPGGIRIAIASVNRLIQRWRHRRIARRNVSGPSSERLVNTKRDTKRGTRRKRKGEAGENNNLTVVREAWPMLTMR